MPQVVILLGVGAGLVAGYKWLSREVKRQLDAAAEREAASRRAESGAPKDLGALEWDETAKVYRPRAH